MSHSALAAGIRHLRSKLAQQCRHEESDEQLLYTFTNRRDDSAFAALVRRHGPMVLHVCRRVLGHEQDAEDAFQATFLVLARNAASLRIKTTLAGFLHGTAYRTALKAKQSAARRRKYEGQASARPTLDPADELSWREVRGLLDEEIALLPETNRSVFILCYLENLSQAEASRRLVLPERTVSNRLAAARKRLAQRLARRGVELTALLTAMGLAAQSAAAFPAGLMASTITAASATTAGENWAGLVSASVVEMAKSMSAATMVSKTKIVTLVLLVAGLLAAAASGSLAYWYGQASGPLAAAAGDKTKIALSKPEAAKTVEIQGRVVDPDGKPRAGAKLLLFASKGKITPLGVAAEDGRFTIAVSKEMTNHYGHCVVAQTDDAGIDFLELYLFKNKKPIELRLVKDNAIHGRVVNTEGKPVRGVRVTAKEIVGYRNNSLDTFHAAWTKLWAGGSGDASEKRIYETGELFTTATDADGRFALHGLGAERTIRLRLHGGGIADTSAWIANRAGLDPKPFNKVVLDRVSKERLNLNYLSSLLSGPDLTVVAEAEKVIRGVVSDADTGKGQPGVMVRLFRDSDQLLHFHLEAKTDAEGRYEIHGIRKTKKYLLSVAGNPDTGHFPSQVWAEDTIAHQPVRADIKVKKGVIITGKLIDGATGESLPGYVMSVVMRGNAFAKDYPLFDEYQGLGQWNSSAVTDAGHAFRVVAIPGPMLLMAKTQGADRAIYKRVGADPKYPQFFTKDGSGYYGYDHMAPLQGMWTKVLKIEPGVAVIHQDIVLEREKTLAEVRIEDGEGRSLTGAWAATDDRKRGISFAPHGGRLESSCCSVYGEASDNPLRIVFYQAERKLTGTLTLKGDEKQPAFVKLGPAGALKGRLLDADGNPLQGMEVELRYPDRAAENIHHVLRHSEERGPILTDGTGVFAYDDVIPGTTFDISFHRDKRRYESEAKSLKTAIQVKPGERRDLGAIKLKRIPETPGE